MLNILHVDNLRKSFGARLALDGVDLIIAPGQVFGLLGPNGSGKTTLLGVLLDVVRPDSGGFTWFAGAPPKNPRNRIGALLETPNFYPYLNADQNLSLVAAMRQVREPGIEKLLTQVQLLAHRRVPFRAYSLGMKQRLALAACLIGNPEVLILDEPTNGLDPSGMIEVRGIIQSIAAAGKTIILASHMLDEVEKICSHVGIMKAGRLLASGPVGSILSEDVIIEVSAAPADMDALGQILSRHPEIRGFQRVADRWVLESERTLSAGVLNRWVFDHGVTLTTLVSKQRSLESEFLEITAR